MKTKQEILDQEHYSFEDLVDIIAFLRAPDGCPWDREQTHTSLKRDFLEECYECIETLSDGDWQHMREELGDVLLQLLLHAQMESEEKHFDMYDVCDELAHKMVYRHPHVFGSMSVQSSKDVSEVWDAQKSQSRGQTLASEKMRSVSKALPALIAAHKIGKKGKKAGFDFPTSAMAMDKVDEELAELKAAIAEGDRDHIEEELGDILLSLTCVARAEEVDSEDALIRANEKFIRRFVCLEKLAFEEGIDITAASDEKRLELWKKAKNIC